MFTIFFLFFSFSFRLTFVSSSDHRLVSLVTFRVRSRSSAFTFYLLYLCQLFFREKENSLAIPHTFTMWFESRFFALGLCC